MKKISQREAHRLWKRLAAYEQAEQIMRRSWSQEYFGGVNIATVAYLASDVVPVAVRTARKLGHAVVVVGDDGGNIRFMALPFPKVTV